MANLNDRIQNYAGLLRACMKRSPDRIRKIARQYGISYLPLMIVQDQKVFEKHAAQAWHFQSESFMGRICQR
ncbi:hypothetical protein [Paraburkholderia graminis]|uniref:hypothetical protein n=1 Tax=Paraburkholderia graminis TaxID=60548 RepID=UPI001FCA3283|nr:hypothetical protein [Paraburkholderia graminis]